MTLKVSFHNERFLVDHFLDSQFIQRLVQAYNLLRNNKMRNDEK